MIYKLIGEALNEVYKELIGETELVKEDLSNIVEVGKTITESSTYGENVENYTKKLIDKVGRIIFRQNKLSISHLPIWRDSWEFGSISEKVRVEAPETSEDRTFDLANYTGEDVFKLSIPKTSAKFFNNSTTFQLKISLPKVQVKSAWNSAKEMSQFISLIENTIKQKLAIDLLSLEYRTQANLIAEKFKSGNDSCLINLLEEYIYETGDTSVTSETFLTNEKALRFANKKIKMMRNLITKPSVLYADGGYVNVTAPDEQILTILTDFDASLATYLYSVNRHNDFVKLENYSVVPYWQAGGTDDSYETRSKIHVIPASEGAKPDGADNRLVIEEENILAVLQDYRASAVTCQHSDVESINVPDARMINYWYFEDANYVNDTDENVIVFYISDYARLGKFASQPSDFGSGYYTKNGLEYSPAGAFNANTVYYKKLV